MASSDELRFELFPIEDPEVVEEPARDVPPAPETADLLARIDAVKRAATRDSAKSASATELAVSETAEVDEPFDEELEELSDEDSLSIAQFYERVRQALSFEFPSEIWVTGEICGIRESRGHRYLELADQGSLRNGRNGAQVLDVVCWARNWPPIAAELGAAGLELEVGRIIRVRGRVSVWEGGSRLRFALTKIDVEALLGGIAAARRRLLQALAAEGLLEANQRLTVPLVPLRIGVVASAGSEGHRDFMGQLARSGFSFETRLEQTLVQGNGAPVQIAAAIGRLERFAPDVTVVIRGGGARADLAAFDSEEVARAIALAPFPIWTGIGHTGDRSVADEVANRSLITPSACGEAIVARVIDFVDGLGRQARVLASLARARLDWNVHWLDSRKRSLEPAVRHELDRQRGALMSAAHRCALGGAGVLGAESVRAHGRASLLRDALERSMSAKENTLERRSDLLRAYDPRRQLQRGWSLTRTSDGTPLRSIGELQSGQVILTRLADGQVESRVEGVDDSKNDDNKGAQ